MPRTVVTPLLVLANVLAFVPVLLAGGGWLGAPSAVFLQLGANFAPLTTGGEWWRLLTAMFLHSGVVHLGFNMLALYQAGRVVEQLYGRAPFALIYFGAGILGGCASLYWRQDVVSVGASGAVFGVYGALLAFLALQPGVLHPQALRALRASALLFVAYSLVLGFTAQGIDNAAHLGGLAGGLLLGAGWAHSPHVRRGAGGAGRALAACAAAVALGAGLLQAAPESAADYRRGRDLEAAIQDFVREEQALNRQLQALQERLRNRQLGDEEAVAAVEQDQLPRWDAQLKRLAALEVRHPAELERVRVQLLHYARLRRDALALLAEAIREQDPAKAEEARRRHAQALQLIPSLHRRPPGAAPDGRE